MIKLTRYWRALLLTAAFAAALVAAACGGPVPTATPVSLASKIEGKWQIVNGQATLRFYGGQQSGVVVRVLPNVFGDAFTPTTTEGTFQWVDATSVRLVFPNLFVTDSTIYSTSIDADRMRLVSPTGSRLEYLRVSG